MIKLRSGDIKYHPNPIPGRRVDNLPRSCVYVPESPTSRVLYLLHGVGDNEYSWEIQGRVSALVEQLAISGAWAHALIVMPFGFVTDDNKVNRRFPDTNVFDEYFFSLMNALERQYEEKQKLVAGRPRERAIAGLSMGGKQALEFGFSHPDLFEAVGGFSAAIQGESVKRTIVDRMIASDAKTRPRFYLSCGTEDGLIEANRALAADLAGTNVTATTRWLPGQHDWAVWRASLQEFLRFWCGRPSCDLKTTVRRIERVEPLPGKSSLEIANEFAKRGRFPYVQEFDWPWRFAPHYHRTVEELQVCRGSLTFVDVRGGPLEGLDIKAGERIVIPEGTVHAAAVGPDGVEYVMGLGHRIPLDEFPVYLPVAPEAPLSGLVELVETNYSIAEAEEEGEKSKGFFEKLLSPHFMFVGARDDRPLNRGEFIEGLERRKGAGRRAHGLHLRREGSAMSADILVTTADGHEYLNARLFQRDANGGWICARWSNVEVELA